jgi:hypothetical protein
MRSHTEDLLNKASSAAFCVKLFGWMRQLDNQSSLQDVINVNRLALFPAYKLKACFIVGEKKKSPLLSWKK